jgi:hypothetical protein
MISEQWTGQDMKGRGSGLLYALSRHLAAWTEGKHQKPRSGQSTCELRFEPGTSGIQSRNITHSARSSVFHSSLRIMQTVRVVSNNSWSALAQHSFDRTAEGLATKCIATYIIFLIYYGLGQRSRYSDWLRAGRLRGRSSSPGGVKNFHFSTSSRPALGFTQPSIQWVPGALSREGKAVGAWSWPLTSNYCRD